MVAEPGRSKQFCFSRCGGQPRESLLLWKQAAGVAANTEDVDFRKLLRLFAATILVSFSLGVKSISVSSEARPDDLPAIW